MVNLTGKRPRARKAWGWAKWQARLPVVTAFASLTLALLTSGWVLAFVPDDLDFVKPGEEEKATAPRASAGGKQFVVPSINYRMIYIPPGTFMMGSPSNEKDRDNDENQHEVTLTKGFYIGVTEVTQGHWQKVMGSNPSYVANYGDDCPVERVSWDDAQEFIRRVNAQEKTNKYRLPTEAEWEYACRAGSTGAYAGDLDSMAWFGTPTTRETGLNQWERRSRMPGDCTTCMGMFGSGVRTGMAVIHRAQ